MTLFKKLTKLAGIFTLAAYLITLGSLASCQRQLLYHPNQDSLNPREAQVNNMQAVTLHTADKLSLTAWYLAAQPERPTIVIFHGNAESLSSQAKLLRQMEQAGFGVLAVEYRGYSGNPGKPTEDGLYEDGRAALHFLLEELKIAGKDIVLWGRSLGTGVAVKMAAEFDTGLLVLISPYSSITEVAQNIYWYAPVKFLLQDHFDSYASIDKVQEPLYLFHGDKDTLVPFAQGKRLYDHAASTEKKLFVLEGQGHHHLDFSYILNEVQKHHPRQGQ